MIDATKHGTKEAERGAVIEIPVCTELRGVGDSDANRDQVCQQEVQQKSLGEDQQKVEGELEDEIASSLDELIRLQV